MPEFYTSDASAAEDIGRDLQSIVVDMIISFEHRFTENDAYAIHLVSKIKP